MNNGKSTSSRSGISRRRLIVGGVGAVCAAAIAGRIWWVNASAFDYPEKRYELGEWCDLDGAFLLASRENTQGLSVRVKEAGVITRREYLSLYAEDPQEAIEAEYDDIPSVLCVALELRYRDHDSCSFQIYEAKLIPRGSSRAMTYVPELWATSNANVTPEMYSFSMRRDSEHTAYIPYVLYSRREEQFTKPIETKKFALHVSNAPVRNIIEIELP